MARVPSFAARVKYTSTDKETKLGTMLEMPDGSVFRYALNGAVAQVAGRLVQSVVPDSNHQNLTTVAAAVGDLTITVTLGATAIVADEFADGYIFVNDAGADTTTEGYTYRIKTHAAAAASASVSFTLYDDTPVIIALTSNSQCSIHHNPFYAVIIHPSPPTAELVGGAAIAVAANKYFWCQTKGPFAAITDGTLVAGDPCVASTSVDGAVSPGTAMHTDTYVGKVMSVQATTEESLVRLDLE